MIRKTLVKTTDIVHVPVPVCAGDDGASSLQQTRTSKNQVYFNGKPLPLPAGSPPGTTGDATLADDSSSLSPDPLTHALLPQWELSESGESRTPRSPAKSGAWQVSAAEGEEEAGPDPNLGAWVTDPAALKAANVLEKVSSMAAGEPIKQVCGGGGGSRGGGEGGAARRR